MPSEIKPQSPRRSLLFVPGDSPRKIEKIRALKVDTVILDLEDSVAIKKKESARQLLFHCLQTTDFGDKDLLVRINASTTDFFQPDVDLIAQAKPAGLVIPKVDSAEILKIIDRQLGVVEHDRGWPSGEIRLLALLESALSIINIKQIAKSTARLDALLFGAEDLAADMNAVRSAAGWEVFYGRSAVATAAAAYGLQAIDTVFVDYQDLVGLEQEAVFARNMGFSGKMAIHPRQIAIIDEVFSPSAVEIAYAQSVLELAGKREHTGTGVFVMNGRMVDAPMVRSAAQLLDRARVCGLLE